MELQDLLPIGVSLLLVGLVLAFGLEILGETRTDLCDATLEHETGSNCYTCPNSTYNTWNTTGLTCDNTTGGDPRAYVSLGNPEYNASSDAIDGVGNFPTKIPLIATVVIAVVIIGILIKYFTTK